MKPSMLHHLQVQSAWVNNHNILRQFLQGLGLNGFNQVHSMLSPLQNSSWLSGSRQESSLLPNPVAPIQGYLQDTLPVVRPCSQHPSPDLPQLPETSLLCMSLLQHNKDLGFLINPGDGAITCVQLFTPPGTTRPSHMFSGSADGSIAIWKAGGDWEHLKLMKGHKSSVNSLAVHPSGRLALSVGHDKALRMWNLLKGRCSYTTPLEAEADVVQFSPSGQVGDGASSYEGLQGSCRKSLYAVAAVGPFALCMRI